MAAGVFTVAGTRVRTSSTRRYVAWIVRRPVNTFELGTPSDIFGRSDSLGALRTRINRRGIRPGSYIVVIDTATGEEVRGW